MSQQQTKAPPVESWRDVIRRKNTHLLFSEDLGPPGTKVDVEIIGSGRTKVTGQDGKDTEKVVLEFRGADGRPKKKKLAIGAEVSKVLDSIFGTDNHYAWRGWVTLYVTRIKVFDQKLRASLEQNAIRIMPEQPKGKPRVARNVESIDEQLDAKANVGDQPSGELSEDEKREIERAEAEANRG